MPVYRATHWPHGDLDLGTTPTEADGFVLRNSSDAADGAQQISPAIYQAGQGFDGADSQEAIFRQHVLPVQADPISATMNWCASVEGGAYSCAMTLDNTGYLYVQNYLRSVYDVLAYNGAIQIQRDLSATLGLSNLVYGITSGSDQITALWNSHRVDAADAIVTVLGYNPPGAVDSITNAATMRLRSFGYAQDTGPTWVELAAVMCDGAIIGSSHKSLVAAAAAGSLAQHIGTGTAGTASAAAAITAGMKTVVIEETVATGALENNLTATIPAGSIVRAVLANCESALTGGGTTATWSVGINGDVDKYGSAGYPTQADSLAKNSKSNWVGATQITTSAEQIAVCAAATGGAAAGDTALTVGTVKVVVVYDTFDAIPDAA